MQNPPKAEWCIHWLADQDYSPQSGSPLRGRLRRSSSRRSLVEPEVLIPVRLKTKPAFRRVPFSLAGGLGFEPRLEESESSVLPLDDPPNSVQRD